MTRSRPSIVAALKQHWPEYLIEAGALGTFMISACAFGVLLEHPDSPVREMVPDAGARRGLMGLAMAATAIGLIYSRFGARSGAHMNPAVTLTFLRLHKIAPVDTVFYVIAQVAGGIAGVALCAAIFGRALSVEQVRFVVTEPGTHGEGAAWMAEFTISAMLMLAILILSNLRALQRWTGVVAGLLVGLFITFEAPLSGMSINPARTIGSAAVAMSWNGLWIYLTAPPLAMLLAAELYVRVRGAHRVYCAKLNHTASTRCIFRCRHDELLIAPQSHSAQAIPNEHESAEEARQSYVSRAI